MTSKEIVKRAVTFSSPIRIPHALSGSYSNDFLNIGPRANPDFKPRKQGQDEWGCVWEKVSSDDKTMGQVKGHPLSSYDDLKNYTFPDFKKETRYSHIAEIIKRNDESENPKFVLGWNPASYGHRVEYLRGTENAWTDPYENTDEYMYLLEHITETGKDTIDRYAEIGGVDGIIVVDDWGFQDRTMISPEMFDKYCKPEFKKLFTHAHNNNMLTFMHSCGYITEFVELLIEAGLNVIQMDQQENMGVENLRRKYGGRICFWCPVDIQQTMINGTVQDVKDYAKNLIDSFGSYNGGFISKTYPSPEAVNHSQEKTNAMCESFIEYGEFFYR